METTTNYKLPQWVKADQIKMDDFNDAFGKLDAALKENADAQTALQEVVNAVKSTAEGAYSSENKPYTAGSYTGNGSTQTITLGFKPSFLVISRGIDEGQGTGAHGVWLGGEANLNDVLGKVLSLTPTGFTVTNSRSASYDGTIWPDLWINIADAPYSYIAFQ